MTQTRTIPVKNGSLTYLSGFLSTAEANDLFKKLENDYFYNDELKSRQSTAFTPLHYPKVMFMTEDLFSKNMFPVEQWGYTAAHFDELEVVRRNVIDTTDTVLEICSSLYYPDGTYNIEYHTDLRAFGSVEIIASVSLGAERLFKVKEIESGEETDILLENGSLLVMGDHFQNFYEHALPKDPDCNEPRINLTFRSFGELRSTSY